MWSRDPRGLHEVERGAPDLPRVLSYAALGDSFTAGAGCPAGARWPDRLAQRLRTRSTSLVYRNLAEEGATSAEVTAQLERAMELGPDLVTLICGVNDVLLSVRPDVAGYAARLDHMFDQLKAVSQVPMVVTATAPESMSFLELGPRSTRRVHSGLKQMNEHTRRLADAHKIPCLDVASHPGLDDPDNFLADGLHPSPLGHARAAAVFEFMLSEHPWLRDTRTWT